MGRGFTNDILTLGVLAVGGYLIYTKTDWFQQFFDAVKSIAGDIKGGGKGGPLIDLGGGGGGGRGGAGRERGAHRLDPHRRRLRARA